MQPTVLIVDDDRSFACAAGVLAAAEGFKARLSHSVQHAMQLLAAERMDFILADLHLPDGSGMDLLENLDLSRHGHIALITGNPSIESAVRAVSAPIVEYLLKPLRPEQFKEVLRRASTHAWRTTPEGHASGIEGLVGSSEPMRAIADTLHRIAGTDVSVLLTGESGTGKEVVARALHDLSGRKGPFVAINCGAVPSELLASQLFGHERGSFTGAHSRHIGVFEQAAHGTLMLDEITEMPIALQVYLLRALESGSVTRVGGLELVETPVRIVAATNRDPHAAIATGALREDLYYRLADISIALPPLCHRGEDVVQIARLFVKRLNERYAGRKFISPAGEQALLRHRWPGNVRELRSAVQRAYLVEPGDELRLLPGSPVAATSRESEAEIVFSVGTSLAEIERQALLKTLGHFHNDKPAAARALGISVRTIHNHLARLASADTDPATLPGAAA